MHLDRETLEQLRVMASEMTAMQKDIASLRIDVSDLSENMKISLHATASLSRMMGSIIQAATRVPLLLVVLPEQVTGMRMIFMSFMTKKVTLHFVCPVTRQLQVSGYYKGVVALHAKISK